MPPRAAALGHLDPRPRTPAAADAAARPRARVQAILWSLALGTVLLAVKLGAWALTGSKAVLSDALESIVNVVASSVALYSVWVASQPADESHPYGHGKAEAFSAGFEGALVVMAAGAILREALPALLAPAPVRRLDVGLVLIAAAGVVNLFLGLFLVRTGRRVDSAALVADGTHVLSDSLTTAGVLAGLLLVRFTGRLWIDPFVAVVVALHLLLVGLRLVRVSIAHLMDTADPSVLTRIAAALGRARTPGWIEGHNLRSWRTGDVHHVDFHLTLPRFWDLEHAHRVQHDVEAAVRAELGDHSDVIVHLDSCVPECCGYCDYEPCPVRAAPLAVRPDWSGDALVGKAAYARRRA